MLSIIRILGIVPACRYDLSERLSMKKILFVAFLLMALGGHLFGQATDSFDIATFNAPAGWGKARIIDSYRISTSSTTGPEFCLITITKSMPALGNSRVNFDAAWQTLVREAVGATAAPEVAAPVDTGDGWEAVSGHSLFAKDGANGVALLFFG